MFGFCLYGGRIKWNDSLFDYKMPKKIILLFFLICIWIFNLSMMVSSCSCSPACALVKIDLKQTKNSLQFPKEDVIWQNQHPGFTTRNCLLKPGQTILNATTTAREKTPIKVVYISCSFKSFFLMLITLH